MKSMVRRGSSRQELLAPGWPEIAIGLLVWGVVGYGVGSQLHRLIPSPRTLGVLFSGLSGVAGLAAFYAAYRLRARDLGAFGIKKTSLRWLMFSVALGLLAVVGRAALTMAVVGPSASQNPVQSVYVDGARGGAAPLVLASLLLGVLSPIGEEFLFRGVILSALRRYGAVIAVGTTAVIFALMHGFNVVLLSALIEGLLAGAIFWRSRSIWTAVVVHATYNLPVLPSMLLAATAQ